MQREQGIQKAESRVRPTKQRKQREGAEGTQASSVCAAGKNFESYWESI